MKNKTVLITGSTSGIGLGIAKALRSFCRKHAVEKFVPIKTITAMVLVISNNAASTINRATFPIDRGWPALDAFEKIVTHTYLDEHDQ